jgi:hypothetical protein
MLEAGRSPVPVPDEVDFFNLLNPSSRTMALGSTQPVTRMSTRNFPGGKKKSDRSVGLTILPPSVSRMSENVGALTSRIPKGLQGLYRDNFTLQGQLYIYMFKHNIETLNLNIVWPMLECLTGD